MKLKDFGAGTSALVHRLTVNSSGRLAVPIIFHFQNSILELLAARPLDDQTTLMLRVQEHSPQRTQRRQSQGKGLPLIRTDDTDKKSVLRIDL